MKICFVALHAYPLFNPKVNHSFGGAEFRSWTLANSLSKLPGYQVSFVVLDHQQPRSETFDNLVVYAHSHYRDRQGWMNKIRQEVKDVIEISGTVPFVTAKKNEGLYKLLSPPFLFKLGCISLYHIWYLLLRRVQRINQLAFYPYLLPGDKTRIYRDINADIYCSFGVHELSSEIAADCRRHKKKFVLFASSDHDFSEQYYPGSQLINQYASAGYLCYYAIKYAHRIIVQTQTQEVLLKERFSKNCTVMPNPIDLSESIEFKPLDGRRGALWVGKSDDVKQPHLFQELARCFPDYSFTMVMNLVNPEINDQTHNQLLINKPVNVRIIEQLPYEEVEHLFSQAAIFVNTSRFEGFPNTFLQAGKYGVPILSLNVDPDHFIEKYDCGIVAGGSFDHLVQGMYILMNDPKRAQDCSDHIREYVRQHHDLNDRIIQLDKLFQDMVQ